VLAFRIVKSIDIIESHPDMLPPNNVSEYTPVVVKIFPEGDEYDPQLVGAIRLELEHTNIEMVSVAAPQKLDSKLSEFMAVIMKS
jgi:hypothetical protein